MEALAHVSQREGHVVIHTDSREALAGQNAIDIYLLITVLIIVQRIRFQGRTIIINWDPSHIGVRGNKLANRLVITGRGMPPNPMFIHQAKTSYGTGPMPQV